jgi:peptidoglycan/LPS O-acetylase OafA/YrhL
VEEQFYPVFPFLVFAWVALNHRKRGRMLANALLAALGFASFITCVSAAQNTPDAAFYRIFCRLWELAVGVLLYQLTARSQAPASGAGSRLAAALPWLGAVAVIATCCVRERNCLSIVPGGASRGRRSLHCWR